MHTYAYIGMHPIHTYAHIPTQYTLSGGAGAQKFKSLSVSTLPIKCDGDGKNKYCSDDGVEEDEQDCDDNENDSVAMEEDGDVYGKSGVVFAFKDSLNFQKDSLANLARRLDKAGKELTILRQSSIILNKENVFSDRVFKLAHRKIPFPYEWISGLDMLGTKSPPRLQDFTSSLGIGSSIGESEYKDFLDTLSILKEEKYGEDMCMSDYLAFYNRFLLIQHHKLFAKCSMFKMPFFSLDVLLLAEVHDSFRHLVKQEYGLSSDWFITLPSLAYDCLLYMIQESGDKVELVSDEEHYRFIQRSKRVIS